MFPHRLAAVLLALGFAASASADILVNDRASEPPGSIQSSPRVATVYNSATVGGMVVVVWTDRSVSSTTSRGRYAVGPLDASSFTNGGAPPAPAGTVWSIDEIVHGAGAFDDSGIFYLTGIVKNPSAPSTIGVGFARGIASAPGSVAFDRVQVAVTFGTNPSSQIFIDATDMQVNPTDNTIFIVYNPALVSGPDRNIYFVRSTNGGSSWSQPTRLSTDSTTAQPVEPVAMCGTTAGDVTFFWYQWNPNHDYKDVMARHSTDNGVSFDAPTLVMTIPNDFHATPNHSTGEHGAAVMARWGATAGQSLFATPIGPDLSLDTFPSLGTATNASEVENNGSAATATPVAAVGNVIRGAIASAADQDWYAFDLLQGEEVSALFDSIPDFHSVGLSVDWFGADAQSNLTSNVVQDGQIIRAGFVAPSTARYYLRLSSVSPSGGYRMRTVWGSTPPTGATDQGDLGFGILAGVHGWSGLQRNNDGAPPGYDDNGVAMASVGDGAIDLSYNDFSVAPGKAQSRRVLRRSTDGGATWSAAVTLSSAITDWAVATGLDGQWSDMATDGVRVYTVWTDGRNGDPDVYLSYVNRRVFVDTTPPFEVTGHPGDTVHAIRSVQNADALMNFNVRMNPQAPGWTLATSTAGLTPGQTAPLDCAFQIPSNATVGDQTVTVYYESADDPPAALFSIPEYGIATLTVHVLAASGVGDGAAVLALEGMRPNPCLESGSVGYSLPRREAVSISVYGVDGRLVRTLVDGERPAGVQAAPWDGRDSRGNRVTAGAYFVAMRAEGRTLTRRVVMLR